MDHQTRILITAATLMLGLASAMLAAERAEIKFDAPDGWAKERIALPPSFAPKMTWKGIEEVRFAPGMFKAESDSFFSYMFVFQVQAETELQTKAIERELLVYYRGLASAVLKGRNVEVDTTKFTLKLTPRKAKDQPAVSRAGLPKE